MGREGGREGGREEAEPGKDEVVEEQRGDVGEGKEEGKGGHRREPCERRRRGSFDGRRRVKDEGEKPSSLYDSRKLLFDRTLFFASSRPFSLLSPSSPHPQTRPAPSSGATCARRLVHWHGV
jgi:hypothetical protein